MSGEMDKHLLKEAAAAFATDGEAISCQRYGSGHINDTFRLICEKHPYILQRMNTDIFQDPVSLMRNIEGVTTFLRQEVMKNNGDPDRETLNLIRTREGAPYYVDSRGNYWRMYLFIEGATCYNLVEKPEDFYQSGKAFGHFQRLLAHYPARELAETIPGFMTLRDAFGLSVRQWRRISAAGRQRFRTRFSLSWTGSRIWAWPWICWPRGSFH